MLLEWAQQLDTLAGDGCVTASSLKPMLLHSEEAFRDIPTQNCPNLVQDITAALHRNDVVLAVVPPGYGKSVLVLKPHSIYKLKLRFVSGSSDRSQIEIPGGCSSRENWCFRAQKKGYWSTRIWHDEDTPSWTYIDLCRVTDAFHQNPNGKRISYNGNRILYRWSILSLTTDR